MNDAVANSPVAQMLYLDSEDSSKPIYLYINSPGGSVTAGLAIYDTMQYVKSDVVTICVGLAASMGAFLLAAGTKGKRVALPHSRIMIHQPLGGTAQRQASDIEIEAREILRMKEMLNRSMAEMSGQSFEKIEKDTDRDYFLSSEEAKNYGLIDRVISHPNEAYRTGACVSSVVCQLPESPGWLSFSTTPTPISRCSTARRLPSSVMAPRVTPTP